MSFKDISVLEFWWHLCLTECNHLCNSVVGIMRDNSLNYFEFGRVVQKMSFKNIPYLER